MFNGQSFSLSQIGSVNRKSVTKEARQLLDNRWVESCSSFKSESSTRHLQLVLHICHHRNCSDFLARFLYQSKGACSVQLTIFWRVLEFSELDGRLSNPLFRMIYALVASARSTSSASCQIQLCFTFGSLITLNNFSSATGLLLRLYVDC